jgi:hypothetical protein
MNDYTKIYVTALQEKTAGIMDDIINEISSYRPTNPYDALTKGVPALAGAGALIGGTKALMAPDEYDERTGEKKSKIKAAIVNAIAGGGIGAAIGAASPAVIRVGANAAAGGLEQIAKANLKNKGFMERKTFTPNSLLANLYIKSKALGLPAIGENVSLGQLTK